MQRELAEVQGMVKKPVLFKGMVDDKTRKKNWTQIMEGLECQANSVWHLPSKHGGASQDF